MIPLRRCVGRYTSQTYGERAWVEYEHRWYLMGEGKERCSLCGGQRFVDEADR